MGSLIYFQQFSKDMCFCIPPWADVWQVSFSQVVLQQ